MKRYDLYMIIRRMEMHFFSYNKGKPCISFFYKKCPSRIIIHMFFVKSLKQKYLQFSIFIVKAILDNVLIFFCRIHLIKWDFLGKPHARLLSGKRIIIHIFFFLLHSSVDSSISTWTDTSTDTHTLVPTHIHSATYRLRVTHRVGQRVTQSQTQPTTHRYT